MTQKKPKPDAELPLPERRMLSRAEAAQYLGIGETLLTRIGPAPVKLGRRVLFDRVDLDRWLDEYKGRGRAAEVTLWPDEKEVSTSETTPPTGGSTPSSPTDEEYARALELHR